MNAMVPAAVSSLDTFTGKLVLALVGVLAGWLIKTLWDIHAVRLRWQRLTPLVLDQIGSAAALGAQSFDARSLRGIERRLIAAQTAAIEMVASGIGKADWPTALSCIADCIDAVQDAADATPGESAAALELLRSRSGSLQKWKDAEAPARKDEPARQR